MSDFAGSPTSALRFIAFVSAPSSHTLFGGSGFPAAING